MPQRGPSRAAVGVAVGLAAVWLAVSGYLHWLAFFGPPGRDPGDATATAALLWITAVAFVNVPAVVAGAAAVGSTRHPGTGPGPWWAARLAFWAALTGPAEVVGLTLLWLMWWVVR